MRVTQIVAMVIIAVLITVVLGGKVLAMLMILAAGIAAVVFGVLQARAFGLTAEEFEPDQFERSAQWVGRGQISLEDHEILVGHTLAGGCSIPTRLVDARALVAELRQPVVLVKEDPRQMALTNEVDTCPGRLPRLPRGYFDGYLSADEPEDTTDWAEVLRGDGSSYWLRTKR